MTDEPSSKNNGQEASAPEVLKPKEETSGEAPEVTEGGVSGSAAPAARPVLRSRRAMYRPSHKATFIGLVVVALVLGVNTVVIIFVLKKQTAIKTQQIDQGQVSINQDVLDKLGVNRGSVGDSGVELTVNPDAKFNGKLQVGGNVSIGGELKLNGTFTAAGASFAKLQGGDTALAQLNVNGNTTMSNANVRNELAVTGTTRLQGPVTISQLLTVNNLNVANNLSVGGVLSANGFHTSRLVVDSTLMIGGHIITQGSSPSATAGNALGSNGTISISGSDAAGTVAANIGTGAGSGTVANITFRTPYNSTPRVVITPVGGSFGGVYVNRSAKGFSIGVSGSMPPGGYAFDYIVMQ